MRQADGFWHVQAPADRYVLRHSPPCHLVEEDSIIICGPTTHLNCLVPWLYKRPSRQLILFHLSPSHPSSSSLILPISPTLILFSLLLWPITFSITAQSPFPRFVRHTFLIVFALISSCRPEGYTRVYLSASIIASRVVPTILGTVRHDSSTYAALPPLLPLFFTLRPSFHIFPLKYLSIHELSISLLTCCLSHALSSLLLSSSSAPSFSTHSLLPTLPLFLTSISILFSPPQLTMRLPEHCPELPRGCSSISSNPVANTPHRTTVHLEHITENHHTAWCERQCIINRDERHYVRPVAKKEGREASFTPRCWEEKSNKMDGRHDTSCMRMQRSASHSSTKKRIMKKMTSRERTRFSGGVKQDSSGIDKHCTAPHRSASSGWLHVTWHDVRKRHDRRSCTLCCWISNADIILV